jgi:FtsH-binding integral membrane protein
MTDFPSIAFQSSLSLAGILFGVFGFLYSLYGLFTSQISTQRLSLPTIAKSLRRICRFLAILLLATACLNACSLLFMYLYSKDINGLGNMILAGAFVVIIFALATVSIIAASFMS